MKITAKAEGGRARIEIIGQISGWKDSAVIFRQQVKELIDNGIQNAHIYISSPGGECFEANDIVNEIRKFPGKITGEGGALVASAATYIAINCSLFSMPENGLFMIHRPKGGAYGTVDDLESYLGLMRQMTTTYFDAYDNKCKDKKKLKDAWDKGDYWLSAKEAMEMGFTTEVTQKTKINQTTAQMMTACGYAGEIEINDNINKKEKDMDITMLASRMGMDATSTEAQVYAQIDVYKRKAERTDQLEARETDRLTTEIDKLLDDAIGERRITADVKEDWKLVLGENLEKGKKMLAAIQPVNKPSVKTPKTGTVTDKTFEQLQEDPIALKNLMDENPQEYERLLDAYVARSNH